MKRSALLHGCTLLFLLLGAGRLSAQAVEHPESFDSAGRVAVITPAIAAELHLGPPAWRITGDYSGARLYRLGDQAYVIAVTRPDGTVERYSITAADRQYLLERTSTLPPDFQEQLGQGLQKAGRSIDRATRNAFVRNQSILGLVEYAPAFAIAISNDAPGRVAGYLLAAGGTFFGAMELARDLPISDAQNRLAIDAAVGGGAAGLGLVYALRGNDAAQAAGVLLGGIGGTAAGLYYGQVMSTGQVAASAFASKAAALVALGGIYATGSGSDNTSIPSRGEAAVLAGAGLLGYPLGYLWARDASYNVTAGDVETLWVTGAIGTFGVGTFLVDQHAGDATTALAITGGFLAGLGAGDYFLVRRHDFAEGDAGILGLGAVAGGLMGAGIYVLADRDRNNNALAMGLSTLGAIGGTALASRFITPRGDAGRQAMRLRFDPSGLALAALRTPGAHPVLSLTF